MIDTWNYGGKRYGLRTFALFVFLVSIWLTSLYVNHLGFSGSKLSVGDAFVYLPFLSLILYLMIRFVWKSDLKSSYRKDYYTTVTLAIASLIFFFLASVFNVGSQIELPSQQFNKIFDIWADDSFSTLSKFNLYYSISNQTGFIIIGLNKETFQNSSTILVEVPSQVRPALQIISNGSGPLVRESYSTELKDYQSHILVISLINATVGEYDMIVNLTGLLYPQALFSFSSHLKTVKAPKNFYEARIELGPFRCQNPCWSDVLNTKPELISNGEFIRLQLEQSQISNSFAQRTSLNTFDSNAQNAIYSMEDFSIGFFIGAITLLVESFVMFMNTFFEGHYSHKRMKQK